MAKTKKTPDNKGVLNKIEQLKKAAVQSHYENRGNVSSTCSSIGIGRTQFYQWKKDDPDFAAAINNVTEFCIDKVEDRLKDKIDEGDITAIIFYLKTIGKKRGYIERHDVGFSESKEITVELFNAKDQNT